MIIIVITITIIIITTILVLIVTIIIMIISIIIVTTVIIVHTSKYTPNAFRIRSLPLEISNKELLRAVHT